MTKRLTPLLLLLLLLISLPVYAVEPGSTAPDFKLQTLDGQSVRLSDYKGQPILLKLATTWCGTCRQQAQEILAAGDYLKKHNVMLVEVFVEDSPQMVRDYLKDKHYPMPHVTLLDDGSVVRAYNVFVIPRTIIIDRDFKIRRDGSLMPASELEAALSKVVAAPKK